MHPVTQTKQLLLKPAKLMWAGNILLFHLCSDVWHEAAVLLLALPPSSFGNGLCWCDLDVRSATALWGCSRDPTTMINWEVHAGKVLKRKAGRDCACAFYPLHDCEITLKIDSYEEERKFVPSVVITN